MMKKKDNFLYRFEQIVQKYPGHTAVLEDGSISITYQELHLRALKIAAFLKANTAGDVIGIEIKKSGAYICVVLGCWYANKAFIPIDLKMPSTRKSFIIKDSNASFVLNDQSYEEALGYSPLQIQSLNFEQNTPAYIIYTSGTTGQPKGVLVSHNGLVNLADCQRKAFKVTHASKYLFYLSVHFDASISDISVSLLSGATLVIENKQPLEIAGTLKDIIAKRAITHIDIPPSLLKLLNPEKMPASLKNIIIGGEACTKATVQKWAQKIRLINVYGPTEATVCTSLCQCSSTWCEPILGQPIKKTTYEIFDKNNQKTSKGELFISGIGLALGYVNNPKLTAQKFISIGRKRYYKTGDLVEKTSSGEYKFLGRIDRQVKLRGQLIELEEIESHLNAHHLIFKSCVLKRPLNEGGHENLVAFIQLRPSKIKLSPIRIKRLLKKELQQYLPTWMVPSYFEIVDEMPLTNTGKINQAFLKNYEIKKLGKHENLTPDEQIIADIFSKITKCDCVGASDNFFDIGGDSLSALELIFECEKRGFHLCTEVLINEPTPRKLATFMHNKPNNKMSFNQLAPDFVFTDSLTKIYKSLKQKDCILTQTNGIHNILLTGATGFLGSHLLKELLDKTNSLYYCLIRAQTPMMGLKRIKNTFETFKLDFKKEYEKRLVVICGDISSDDLCLGTDLYNRLSSIIDTVYHCAATVNMIYPYEKLKDINLNGVKRIARFCMQGKRKALHYASTLSVFVSTDRNTGTALENDLLDGINYIYGGYGQSKFTAEKYLLNVPSSLCDCYIYRFGLLTGHTRTGLASKNDFLGMFVKGAKEIGALPKDETGRLAVDITPIDYAARVMADISLSNTHKRIFHIAGKEGLKYTDFAKFLLDETLILKIIPFHQWEKILKKMELSRNGQACVMSLCRLNSQKYEEQRLMDLFQATDIVFDNTNVKEIIHYECPPPSEELIKKYIRHMERK